MAVNVKDIIINKIKEYDTVILCRHIRPDGDAIGGTLALMMMIKAAYPEKRVFVERKDDNPELSFLGDQGPLPEDVDFKDALVIIIDTAAAHRVSSDNAFSGKEIIKIDHHIPADIVCDISWTDPSINSVCEMITELWSEHRDDLMMTKEAALNLFVGIVTDSGRFKYRGTTSQTLRCAAMLMDYGFDYERVYSLLDAKDLNRVKNESALMSYVKFTPTGVAYLYLSKDIINQFCLSGIEASDSVDIMGNIKETLIWLVFIENDDGSIRVRIRSRFVAIQSVAKKFNGGGHELASGATVYSKEDVAAVLADLDLIHGEFKNSNPDLF